MVTNTQELLKDTVDSMLSDDFKERFIAEYIQTKVRYDALHRMLIKYRAGTLTLKCSYYDLLAEQAEYMGNYLRILEIRAEIEGIELFIK